VKLRGRWKRSGEPSPAQESPDREQRNRPTETGVGGSTLLTVEILDRETLRGVMGLGWEKKKTSSGLRGTYDRGTTLRLGRGAGATKAIRKSKDHTTWEAPPKEKRVRPGVSTERPGRGIAQIQKGGGNKRERQCENTNELRGASTSAVPKMVGTNGQRGQSRANH